MKRDVRRYPRAGIGLDVTVKAASSQWQGKTLNLSPYGVKIGALAKSVNLPPGTSVQLWFPQRGQDPSLSLTAKVERTDPDGIALSFTNLRDQQFQQLNELVDSLLLREWQDLLGQLGAPRLPDPNPGIPNRPESLEANPPVEKGDGASEIGASRRESEGEVEQVKPLETSGSEKDRWQHLLNRLGLENLRLPGDGRLTRQWQEFLRRLEAEESQGRGRGKGDMG